MKKVFTFLAVFILLASFVSAQKNVAYVTKQKDMDPEAWPVDNDVIIQLLNADANINLTVFVCDGSGNDVNTATPVDLSSFDAIIAAETFSSGDAVWQSGNPLYLGTLPAPTLYNKIYSLRKDKALTTGDGVSNDAQGVFNMAVDAPTHDIFKGIDVSTGVITVVKCGVGDSGDLSYEKAMQYNTGNVVSGTTMLGHPEGTTDAVLSFDDLSVGATIDDVTIPVRVISFAMNHGQLTYKGGDGSGINLTTEGLTLWRNAIYIVAGLDVPSTSAVFPSGSGVSNLDIKEINAYGINGGIKISADSDATVYSITGKVVAKNVNTEFVACPQGVYIVRIGSVAKKVMVTR